MTTAFDGRQQPVFCREPHSRGHVGGAVRLHHQRGMPVPGGVQQQPCLVVGLAARQEDVAPDAVGKLLDSRCRQQDLLPLPRDRLDVFGDLCLGVGHLGECQLVVKREGYGCSDGRLDEMTAIHVVLLVVVFGNSVNVVLFLPNCPLLRPDILHRPD